MLPAGDFNVQAGAQDQYESIWNSVGGSHAGLSGQFDGVVSADYWSGTVYAPSPGFAWNLGTYNGRQLPTSRDGALFAVAVRPGDVAAAVPEPQTDAMLLLGLGALMVAVRRRRPD